MAGPNLFSDLIPSGEDKPKSNLYSDLVPDTVAKEKEEKGEQYKSLLSLDFAKDAARTALQGFSLGHSDEAIAKVRALIEKRPYEETRQEERDAVKRYAGQMGPAATVTELGGGLAMPMVGPLKTAFQGVSTVGKAAKAVPLGYGMGFVSGVGASESEKPGDWLSKGHESGITGAILAPAIPVAGRFVGGALRKADTAVQASINSEKAAQLYLADKIRSRGGTEAEILADLQRGREAANFHVGKTPDEVAEAAILAGKSDAEALKAIKVAQTKQANAQAPLPETIADTTPAMQRTLRGIKVGGEADHVIEPFLSQRQAGSIDFTKGAEAGGQYGRLGEQQRLALRISDEALPDKLEKLTAKRGAEAKSLFSAAEAASADPKNAFDLSKVLQGAAVDAMNMPNPADRLKLLEAVRLFNPNGYAGGGIVEAVTNRLARIDQRIAQMEATTAPTGANAKLAEAFAQKRDARVAQALAQRNMVADDLWARAQAKLTSPGTQNRTQFAVDNVQRYQKSKEALDDLIDAASGHLRGKLKQLRYATKAEVLGHDAEGNVTRNAEYAKALDKFASRSEILDAAQLGRDFATGKEQITPRIWRALSEAEKGAARAGWLHETQHGMGGKSAGPTTDYTQELRKPNTAAELRLILPPQAGASAAFPGGNREKLSELVKRETRISDTAKKALGNSTTAEKAVDAIDIGRVARVTRYIKDSNGLFQAAAGSLSDALEKMSAIKGQRALYLAKKMLSVNPGEQEAFLKQVETTYGRNVARRLNEAFGRWLVQFEASVSGAAGRSTANQDEGAR